MFDNIGGKIKILAKVRCWVGIIGFVLFAIYVWVTIGRYGVGLGFALFIISSTLYFRYRYTIPLVISMSLESSH